MNTALKLPLQLRPTTQYGLGMASHPVFQCVATTTTSWWYWATMWPFTRLQPRNRQPHQQRSRHSQPKPVKR